MPDKNGKILGINTIGLDNKWLDQIHRRNEELRRVKRRAKQHVASH